MSNQIETLEMHLEHLIELKISADHFSESFIIISCS